MKNHLKIIEKSLKNRKTIIKQSLKNRRKIVEKSFKKYEFFSFFSTMQEKQEKSLFFDVFLEKCEKKRVKKPSKNDDFLMIFWCFLNDFLDDFLMIF